MGQLHFFFLFIRTQFIRTSSSEIANIKGHGRYFISSLFQAQISFTDPYKKSVGAHIGQFGAQWDKLTPQMGLLGNHMAQLRAQMSQLGINQWPKAIIWLAVALPCSFLA